MPRSIEEGVEAYFAGVRPQARKAGRNPKWPHVPILVWPGRGRNGPNNEYHEQIRGKAFASREEAVGFAERHLARAKKGLAARMAEPRNRALREQWEVEI